MSQRVRDNVAQARYRDRNKLFSNFRSGDLVQISLFSDYSSVIKGRTITKNDKGKFVYNDIRKNSYLYTMFNCGQIGLFLGRYDGRAVLLINEGLYSIQVDYVKKVEGNDG